MSKITVYLVKLIEPAAPQVFGSIVRQQEK